MRNLFRSVIPLLLGNSLFAQEPAMPPSALITGRFVIPGGGAERLNTPSASIRARIRSYDGRMLVSRGTPSSALAWLADTTSASRDTLASSVFTVSFVGPSALRVANAKGECLTLTPNESAIPLAFGRCDREPLWMYPAANGAITSGDAGFWILSRLGMVGPGEISPLLMPRSNLRVWFRIERVQ